MKLLILLALVLQDDPSDIAKKAMEDLEAIRAKVDQHGELRGRARTLQEDAQRARSQGDNERMEKIQKELMEIVEKLQEVRTEIEVGVDKLNKTSDEGLAKDPDDWGLLAVRGNLHLLQGDLQKAIADLEKSEKIHPGRLETLLRLGETYYAVNRYENALKSLDSVLRKEPGHAEAWAFRCLCLFAVDRFEECEKEVAELLEKKKDQIKPRLLPKMEQSRKWAGEMKEAWARERKLREDDKKADDLPRVKLKTSKGDIVLELFENEAPNTVANFVNLVEKGFYDGTKFHRVIPNFMAQGGCPNSKDEDPSDDGRGGPGYCIDDEWVEGTSRIHFRGSISMANAGPDTNGSQFFLTHLPTPWLNSKHTVFGRILEGQSVVDSLLVGDVLEKAEVVRKRDHKYEPEKNGE